MRGEDSMKTRSPRKSAGSPPHARGRRQHQQIRRSLHRITPACAGKTSAPPSFALYRQDHPRMRGEDHARRRIRVPGVGSPPHARGRRVAGMLIRTPRGITPACAGKTAASVLLTHVSWDHPRMRGEDLPVCAVMTARWGSPPHARGRPLQRPKHDGRHRITPACAGKTPGRTSGKPPPPDHPRMRGEDAGVAVGVDPFGWITPACAGKTAS